MSFLFVFLPISLLMYCLSPRRYRSGVILAISFLFYGLIDIAGLCLMVAVLLLDYAVVYRINTLGRRHALSRLLCGAVAVWTVGIIVVMSAYTEIVGLIMPLGLYIYLLTALGYVVDFYRGEAPFERSPVNFFLMCCFFPKLYAGPLVEYSEMSVGLQNNKLSVDGIGAGLMQFTLGLAKKVILADQIGKVYVGVSALPSSELTIVGAWMLVFSSAFSIYFTLSGYCDIAMGLGRVFGFTLPHNFSYPFQSRTVTDFFARFNITVSRYIRRYVYRFLGYDTGGKLSNALNLMLVAMLAALWFGLRMNLLFWGGFLGVFMIIESMWGVKFFSKIPPFFLRVYAFLVVMFSFAIFAGENMNHTVNILGAMVDFGGREFLGNTAQYFIETHGVIFVLCALLSTSICHRVGMWMEKRGPALTRFVQGVGSLALLLLCVSFIIL